MIATETRAVNMTVTIYTQESIIADRIGFRYDAETGTWYNANDIKTTEQNAGYVAYEVGVEYNELPTPGLRLGWDEARGYAAYTGEMWDWLENGDLPRDELDF